MDHQSSPPSARSRVSSSALATLASHLNSDVNDVRLLRLRFRLGSPRCIASGVAFRVVVDLVDEMAQPPVAALASELKTTMDVFVRLDASYQEGFELESTRQVPGSSSALQWKFDCVVTEKPDVPTAVDAIRLHVSCSPRKASVPLTDSHALLRSFCVASQWVHIPAQRSQILVLAVVSDSIRVVPSDNAVFKSAHANSSLCLREFAVPSAVPLQIEEDYGEAMGSHIWDASIYLSLALIASSEYKQDGHATPMTMLELGAGCGLFAVVFARLAHARSQSFRMVLTEKGNSIDRINGNLQRNNVNGDRDACVRELVWGSKVADSVSSVCPVSVIFAADVLYHWSAHEALLETLEDLVANDFATPVVIAHKRRGEATATRLDGVLQSGRDVLCKESKATTCRWAQWHVKRLAGVANVDVLQLTRQKS